MKLILCALLFVSQMGIAKTDPELEKYALKIIRLTLTQSSELEVFHKTFKQLIQKNDKLDKAKKAHIIGSVEKQINRSNMESLFVPVYVKHYTLEDMKALLAFYESPAGKKLVKVDPLLRKELAQAGLEYGKRVMSDIALQIQIESSGPRKPAEKK